MILVVEIEQYLYLHRHYIDMVLALAVMQVNVKVNVPGNNSKVFRPDDHYRRPPYVRYLTEYSDAYRRSRATETGNNAKQRLALSLDDL